MPTSSFPLVIVEWRDAWFDPDETEYKDWLDEYPVRSVGFLVRDTAELVSLAGEVLPGGEGFRAVTHIPRSLVVGMEQMGRVQGSQAFTSDTTDVGRVQRGVSSDASVVTYNEGGQLLGGGP